MKTRIRLLVLMLPLPVYPETGSDNIVIGKYLRLHSSVTNEDRTLLAWLPDNPQQGVNEKSLAYNSNRLPGFEVNP